MARSATLLSTSIGLGLLFCASSAHAGAWTEAAGNGKLITTIRATSAEEAFDDRGESGPQADFQKSSVEVYAARGITDSTTAVLQTSFVKLRIGTNPISGWDDTQLGLQQRILDDERQVFSVLVSGLLPGDSSLTSGSVDGEFRLLYGRSFEIAGKPAYANFEVGYRRRANGFADQVRPDFTIGWSATPEITIMAQSFNTATTGDGATDYEGQQNKAQLSALWSVSAAASIQVGGFATIDGSNTPRERGLLASLWMNF